MATFDITRPTTTTTLDEARRAVVPFSITNLSTRSINGHLEIVPRAAADRSVFTIEGGSEHQFAPNQTLNVRALIAVTGATPAGPHAFTLKVVDVDHPDEYFGESQPVEFVVQPQVRDDRWKRWLWIAAAAVAVMVVGGTGWYLYLHPRIDDYHRGGHPNPNVDVAMDALTRAGMQVTKKVTAVVLEPTQDRTVVMQMNGDEPADGPARVRRGTAIALDYAVLMPKVRDMKKEDALLVMNTAGINEGMIQFATRETRNQAEVGRILEQKPDPGVPAEFSGNKIALTVGISPQPIPLENMTNVEYCAASSRLSALGFRVFGQADGIIPTGTLRVSDELQRRMLGLVKSQSPPPNTLHTPGMQVNLVYRGGPKLCFIDLLVVPVLDRQLHQIRRGAGSQ